MTPIPLMPITTNDNTDDADTINVNTNDDKTNYDYTKRRQYQLAQS